MLGCYILYEDKDFWVARFRTDLTKIFRTDILEGVRGYTEYLDFEYVLAIWTVSSLFHDYGRVIEDAQKEFKRVKDTYNEVINNLPEAGDLSFNIPLFSEELVELSLAEDLFKENLRTYVDARISQIIEESMGELRHGNVSSELLIHHFYYLQTSARIRIQFYYFFIDNTSKLYCNCIT